MSTDPGLIDLLLGPFRELRTLTRVKRLWEVEARLQAAYLLRFPAWFIYRERRAIGKYRFEDESFFFGETPYDVAVALCARMGLGADDVLYDLGCGRGKMVFTSHLHSGCQAVGVDLLPTYIDTASRIARAMRLQRARFEREDVLGVPLDDATAIYLNAFTFSDDLVGGLRARISMLEEGCWWTSVGKPWDHPRLQLQDRMSFAFSWGRAEVWLYRVGPTGNRPPAAAEMPFERVLAETMSTSEDDE